MRSLTWRRDELIARISSDVWRYLSPAADVETELLEASALLKMPPREIQTVAQLQFLASDELGALLAQMPFLVRRLATTTTSEEEWSAERVRGTIQWSKTVSMRAASGLPHLFVTEPARRAFQTPENELLVFLLDEVVRLGRLSGWYRVGAEGIGRLLTERVQEADRWRHARMLATVERRPITAQRLARIRSGRHRRRYEPVLDAWAVHRALVGTMDRAAIRDAVESHGLVTRSDPTLFELVCTFDVIEAIKAAGWRPTPLHLFEGSLRLTATRAQETLRLHYQHTPQRLRKRSRYGHVQRSHAIPVGGLIPDLVLHRPALGADQWLLIEVKGGTRSVDKSARAALLDLLAYRRSFGTDLASAKTYGIGVAYGAELDGDLESEIRLCTPDRLPRAIASFLE